MMRRMALPAPTPESTVVVTGASSGIGAELARELARRGYGVTLVARRTDLLEALADELPTASRRRVAATSPTARSRRLVGALRRRRRRAVQQRRLRLVRLFHEADLERELGMVTLNVEALHQLTGALLPRLVRRGAGRSSTSVLRRCQPIPNMATYAATKAFVASFSRGDPRRAEGTGVW